LVVIDFFMSETAERADVVLPATIWLEDEGTTTNLEGRVVKMNKAAEPPGEARSDWQIMGDLADRMGRGSYFPYQTSREIFEEIRVATRGTIADYSGITWERIERENGVFWPCPSEDHPGSPRLFEERFFHPDGRARMFVVPYEPPAEEPSEDFPFRLTTGRVVYHYLSGTQTRRLEFLNSQAPDAWVEMHPQAAARLGVADGEVVRVRTPRNSMEVRAVVVPTIRPDTIFIPFHYGHGGAANQLTNPAMEPNARIPEYKACAAAVEKVGTEAGGGSARSNYSVGERPELFPYETGEKSRLS
jgi:assimilatory nitrate reductase catalytic subunit